MTPSKSLPPHSSFESLRKQAKKLVRQFADGDSDALARVHAQLPVPELPLSLRDAQLVLAREYGFAGWQDLRTAVLRQEGKGLEWAAAEAERVYSRQQRRTTGATDSGVSCASILARRFRRIHPQLCHRLVRR